MAVARRGASYPSLSLSDAISKLRIVHEKVGKGPSSKEEYVKGLGYSGLSGASTRTFAALIHYGLLEKSGVKYKFSDLALHILFPKQSNEPEQQDLIRAALTPKLFKMLYDRFVGENLPTMLKNTLVLDYQIHDKSAEEASSNFRQTLDFAGLLKNGGVIASDSGGEAEDLAEEPEQRNFEVENSSRSTPYAGSQQPLATTMPDVSESINRIEIVLREGVKAGIYAPYNLSDAEKQKLKSIIDLL